MHRDDHRKEQKDSNRLACGVVYGMCVQYMQAEAMVLVPTWHGSGPGPVRRDALPKGGTRLREDRCLGVWDVRKQRDDDRLGVL